MPAMRTLVLYLFYKPFVGFLGCSFHTSSPIHRDTWVFSCQSLAPKVMFPPHLFPFSAFGMEGTPTLLYCQSKTGCKGAISISSRQPDFLSAPSLYSKALVAPSKRASGHDSLQSSFFQLSWFISKASSADYLAFLKTFQCIGLYARL